jgi:uncharacterized protein
MQRIVPDHPPTMRLTPPPRRSTFLFGPRGTGKSTAARQWFPEARTFDLRDSELGSALSAAPHRLHDLINDEAVERWIVIDEIQRVPALLDVVHQRLDREPGRRFLMTGSSPRRLYRAGANLLGGRADIVTMPSFLASELCAAFTLGKAMRVGMLPVVCTADDPEAAIRSYVRVAVYEELRFEATVRRLDDFSRALEQFSLCQGALWSPTTIAAAAQAKKSTVTEWFRILEEMFLVARLEVFRSRPSRRSLALTPKVYFADCGVALALRPTVAAREAPEAVGATREGLVYQHLAAWCSAQPRAQLWTWRTTRGVEVDFVVETPDELIGIDVKSTHDLRPADRRGQLAFHDEFPDARLIALTDSVLPGQSGPIREQPLESWLRRLVPTAPLP